MTDALVLFTANDVKGAILSEKCVQKNTGDALRRWLRCRGMTAGVRDSHKSLVQRVRELMDNGMQHFVMDPDRETTLRVLQEHVMSLRQVDLPVVDRWTESLDALPRNYSYLSLVEYLLKRKVTVLDALGSALPVPLSLPVADKPLVKGHNFFASGNVGEILLNDMVSVVHVRTGVLASMRERRYDVKCAIDNKTGLVVMASCECPAGAGGKCNHVSSLMFAMLDYVNTMRNPDCCTSQPQTWHRPERKRKRATKPMVVGERAVKKHVYGRVVTRKRPLEDYANFSALSSVQTSDRASLMSELRQLHADQHNIGLLQVLDSSTDSASSEAEDTATISENLTPEEVVVKRLQVTEEEQRLLERRTLGQADNKEWFVARVGRLTASKAKQFCGRGDPARLLRSVIQDNPINISRLPHVKYGIDNESLAVDKYVQQNAAKDIVIVVRECGLFVDVGHGQLAASPDRLAVCNGEDIVLEVKCLSSCRTMSPLKAVQLKEKDGAFAFKMVNGGITLKEKHAWYYQVQMQMAITNIHKCHLIIFTSSEHEVYECALNFDEDLWHSTRAKLLDFHSTYVVPALVNKLCR